MNANITVVDVATLPDLHSAMDAARMAGSSLWSEPCPFCTT